jgi:probable rRNA maturation factor
VSARRLEITVLNRQRGRRIDARAIERFLSRLADTLPPRRGDGLALCLVSDRRMRAYNRVYRGTDAPTDVLSFPAPRLAGGAPLGDIVIAVPTAARQARRAGHGLARELRLLALHGYLHLLGYDHETDDGTMRRLQARLWRRLDGRAARGAA